MANSQEDQRIATDAPHKTHGAQSYTDQVPPLISKKWLCVHFGLTCPGGKPNTTSLYSKVLTPDVLEAVGLTETQVRCRQVRTFDRTTSRRLIEALGL